MEPQPFSEDLRRYIALAWHWAWLLALAAVLAGGTAYLVSKRMTPLYQASTLVQINEAPGTRSIDYTAIMTNERIARTYTEVMVSRPVLEGVIQELGLELSSSTLKGMVQVQPVRDTQLIRVQVQDVDPARAARIANTLVDVFAEQNLEQQRERYLESKESLKDQLAEMDLQIQGAAASLELLTDEPNHRAERERLETTLSQYRQTYANLLQSYEQVRLTEAQSISKVSQVEAAIAPAGPISPRVLNNTALAAVVGLMLAAGLIFLVEALNDTVGSPNDITQHLGLPVLGLIARHPSSDTSLICIEKPRSPVSEAFRALRTNLQYTSVDRPLKTLLVTSPSPEDGKTTMAANLGVTLAQFGRRVVVLDLDMRRPRVHRTLGLANRKGVSDLFVQPEFHFNGTLQATEVDGLSVMSSGCLPPNPSELLGSEKMTDILQLLGREADIVVVDSPPLLAVTDAAIIAPRVDGVLLVVKPGVTKLAACRQAVEQLQRVGANLLGVVLNDVDLRRSHYKYSYYKSYYSNYHKYYGPNGHD